MTSNRVAEDGCSLKAAEDGCSFKAALQKAPPLWFFLFLHIPVWGFSFCLLCSSCCVALPHVASPPCRQFCLKGVKLQRLWAQAGPVATIIKDKQAFLGLRELRKSRLWEGKACWPSTSARGGKEVSRELEGENQALRDEISGQRVSRPKRRQTSRRWTVTKPDACSTPASWEDATRLPAPERTEVRVRSEW